MIDYETWEEQVAEAETLQAIYQDDFKPCGSWTVQRPTEIAFTVTVDSTMLRFKFPHDYPKASCVQVDVELTDAASFGGLKKDLTDYVNSLPLGMPMTYDVVTRCQELLADDVTSNAKKVETVLRAQFAMEKDQDEDSKEDEEEKETTTEEPVIEGTPVTEELFNAFIQKMDAERLSAKGQEKDEKDQKDKMTGKEFFTIVSPGRDHVGVNVTGNDDVDANDADDADAADFDDEGDSVSDGQMSDVDIESGSDAEASEEFLETQELQNEIEQLEAEKDEPDRESRLSALQPRDRGVNKFLPGLFVLASFLLVLMSLKKIFSFQKPCHGSQVPLMHT